MDYKNYYHKILLAPPEATGFSYLFFCDENKNKIFRKTLDEVTLDIFKNLISETLISKYIISLDRDIYVEDGYLSFSYSELVEFAESENLSEFIEPHWKRIDNFKELNNIWSDYKNGYGWVHDKPLQVIPRLLAIAIDKRISYSKIEKSLSELERLSERVSNFSHIANGTQEISHELIACIEQIKSEIRTSKP